MKLLIYFAMLLAACTPALSATAIAQEQSEIRIGIRVFPTPPVNNDLREFFISVIIESDSPQSFPVSIDLGRMLTFIDGQCLHPCVDGSYNETTNQVTAVFSSTSIGSSSTTIGIWAIARPTIPSSSIATISVTAGNPKLVSEMATFRLDSTNMTEVNPLVGTGLSGNLVPDTRSLRILPGQTATVNFEVTMQADGVFIVDFPAGAHLAANSGCVNEQTNEVPLGPDDKPICVFRSSLNDEGSTTITTELEEGNYLIRVNTSCSERCPVTSLTATVAIPKFAPEEVEIYFSAP